MWTARVVDPIHLFECGLRYGYVMPWDLKTWSWNDVSLILNINNMDAWISTFEYLFGTLFTPLSLSWAKLTEWNMPIAHIELTHIQNQRYQWTMSWMHKHVNSSSHCGFTSPQGHLFSFQNRVILMVKWANQVPCNLQYDHDSRQCFFKKKKNGTNLASLSCQILQFSLEIIILRKTQTNSWGWIRSWIQK
jgi:hypothetical protein